MKSISPLIMNNNKGCNPLEPLTKKIKEISSIKKKNDDHHHALNKLNFMSTIYWSNELGVYIPSKMIMGCFKAAARKDRNGKSMKAVLIDAVIGIPIIGMEKETPESLYAVQDKSGERKYVFTEPVTVVTATVMRTRPIIDKWEIKFNLYLNTELLPAKTLEKIIETAGFEYGMGDCRPEKVTGPYGRFTLESFKEKT